MTNSQKLEARGAAITLRNATKRYQDGSAALNGIDLDVEAGEFMTFLGPSGSGKTTTLNLIAGFTDFTAGDLSVGGHAMKKTPSHRRNIGVVFQNYALFPHMTVRENVEFPLRQRKVSAVSRRELVDLAISSVRLEGYENRRTHQLSGGQQQRVAFARAIVFKPPVLLMDEPLGALDKKLRDALQLEIKRIHGEIGSTFVYVTHDQEEALALSDRIAVFRAGNIEQIGTAADLYRDPASVFVGTFIGESTVIGGECVEAEGELGVLRSAGSTFTARTSPAVRAGAAGAVLVRPECLHLHRTGGTEDPTAWNTVRVRLLDQIYLGSGWRCRVTLPDGSVGVIRRAEPLAEDGAALTMSWHPEDGVLLPFDDPIDHPRQTKDDHDANTTGVLL